MMCTAVTDPSLRGRFIQCFMYLRQAPMDNHYAHPLDLVVNLELHSRKVLDCFMHEQAPVIPPRPANFVAALAERERPWRSGLRPLNVIQPEGPSFSVSGNQVSWQKWNMRISFNYREGLVLHHVGWAPGHAGHPPAPTSLHFCHLCMQQLLVATARTPVTPGSRNRIE